MVQQYTTYHHLYLDAHTHRLPQTDGDAFRWCALSLQQTEMLSVPDLQGAFCVGLHPWYIKNELLEQQLHQLSHLLAHHRVWAVGECGLDRLCATPWNLQLQAFEAQIRISEQHRKPLVIHCVRAFDTLLQLKKTLRPRQKWLIHGFNKKEIIARQLLQAGFFLSLGAAALLPSMPAHHLAATLPLEYIFLESDDNNELSIKNLYQTISQIRSISPETLRAAIWDNFETLLKN